MNESAEIDVLLNDSDADGDPISLDSFSQGANGAVAETAGGLTYTPTTDFSGFDTFTYVITDVNDGTATATVFVVVTAAGSDLKAINDEATVTSGESIVIDVLANDIGVDGETITLGLRSAPSHGTATIEDGQVRYEPSAGYSGEDSFVYTIEDGRGGVGLATVKIRVLSGESSLIYLPMVIR